MGFKSHNNAHYPCAYAWSIEFLMKVSLLVNKKNKSGANKPVTTCSRQVRGMSCSSSRRWDNFVFCHRTNNRCQDSHLWTELSDWDCKMIKLYSLLLVRYHQQCRAGKKRTLAFLPFCQMHNAKCKRECGNTSAVRWQPQTYFFEVQCLNKVRSIKTTMFSACKRLRLSHF